MRFSPTCSMTQKFYLKSVKWTWSGARTAPYLQNISTSEQGTFKNKRWNLEFDYGQLQMNLILLTQLKNTRLTWTKFSSQRHLVCNPLISTFHIDFIKTKRFKWHSHISIFVYMEIFICRRTSAHECTAEMHNKSQVFSSFRNRKEWCIKAIIKTYLSRAACMLRVYVLCFTCLHQASLSAKIQILGVDTIQVLPNFVTKLWPTLGKWGSKKKMWSRNTFL